MREPTMKTTFAVLVILLSLVAEATAWAQSDAQDQARKAFVRGDAAYKASRFDEALAAFTEGYDLSRRPRFLLNIAHTQRKLGHMRAAAATYRRFLLTDPKPEDRELAQQMVDEIEALLAEEAALKPSSPSPPDLAPPPEPPPAERTATAASPMVLEAEAPTASEPALYTRWYFWAGVTGVVALGVLGAIALSADEPDAKRAGSWGELRL